MKKKILFVASVPGHIKAFHIPYLKWFKEQGYETHIAVNEYATLDYVDQVHVVNFDRKLFSKSNIDALIQLKKLLDSEKYLLVNCHTAIASALTRLVSSTIHKYGGKLLYTAHGFIFSKNTSIKKWLLFFPVELLLSRYTDALITINHEDYDLIRKYGSKRCNYYIIPGIGVDNKKFHPVENSEKSFIRNKLNIKKKVVLTYVARLEKIKGHDFIINCVLKNRDIFKDINILFVGDGELRNKYESEVYQNNIDDIISFLGFRNDVKDIFCASDYCLSSARDEGFGINLIEGMMCGLPAIASRTKGHNEFLIDNQNGFMFDFGDEHRFIEIIKNITNNNINYEHLSLSAIENSNKFTVNSSLKKMTSIYREYL